MRGLIFRDNKKVVLPVFWDITGYRQEACGLQADFFYGLRFANKNSFFDIF